MGLDQMAYRINGEDRVEIAYWRKHNRLQGWMEKLWHSKGGTGEFNLVDVDITEEDLDSFENAVTKQNLPSTDGFFFGGDAYRIRHDGLEPILGNRYADEPADLKFIEDARKVLSEGDRVVYSCWW